MKILFSILVASILVVSALAAVPVQQAYAGHIVSATTIGSGTTGLDITAEGVISDINGALVSIADDLTITDNSPLVTLDDIDGGTDDATITAGDAVLTIDTDTANANAGQLVVLGDSVFGTTGVDTFDWVTAGGDTFNIGTGGVDTINMGTGVDIDTINIGTGGTGVDVITIGGGASTIGFYGAAPVVRAAAYTLTTPVAADRTLDSDVDAAAGIGSVLETLIEDLQLYGLLQ